MSQGYASATTLPTPWADGDSKGDVSLGGDQVLGEFTVTKKILAKDVTDLQVLSIADVMPEDLNSMKVRELQTECDNWGIQCSGGRTELLERLNKFFRGEMCLKKGCSKKFVRLVESATSSAAGSGATVILPKAKSKVVPAKKLIPEPKHGSSPPPSGSAEGCSTFQQMSDERIFRRNLDARLAAATLGQEETPQKDPRTGLVLPSGMEVGRSTALVRCPQCTADMVLRRNRIDGGLFFGCSQFAEGRCKGTRKLEEIVEGQQSAGFRQQ